MKTKIITLALLVSSLTGCSAFKSLIGHPLAVVWRQHQNVEVEECLTKSVVAPTPIIIYKDCDNRVDTNWVSALARRSGTNFLGVYLDMAAVWHPEDKLRNAGVAMISTCSGYQGEYLKDISSKDFEDIFVNKTKPEYSK
jgi:hypothetical protein